MKLHKDTKFFTDTIRAASQYLGIIEMFIEKDYWITLVLSQLAKSRYADTIVFKGGTSLSKGFGLIDRFSEDVDIAIIHDDKKSGNEIKTIIRTVEKEMTPELNELQLDGVTSKGSRFRKSVFEYMSIDSKNMNNTLIIEVNSFANPFPFQHRTIKSFVFDFLTQTDNENYIKKFDLQPFDINVLNKEQTLLEKLVSLIRFSYDENMVETISQKIRHFYDLHFLATDVECAHFMNSVEFKKRLDQILNHDKKMFDEPIGWKSKLVSESPLVLNFENIWQKLKGIYRDELSALAYSTIPDEKVIAQSFGKIIIKVSHFQTAC